MFGAHLTPYRGPAQTILAGATRDMEKSFVPNRGPRGGRNIIHGIEARIVMNHDSVGTAISGVDLAMVIRRLRVRDGAGERIDLQGDRLFAWAQDMLGNMVKTPDALGTQGAAGSHTVTHYIPFALPRLARPKDTALEPETWNSSDFVFEIQAPSGSDFQGSSPNITAATGFTVTLVAWCSEEFSYEEKVRFVVSEQVTSADAEFDISAVGAKPIVSIFLHKTGSAGGASMANIDRVTIQKLGLIEVEDEHMERMYAIQRVGGWFEDDFKSPHNHVSTLFNDAGGVTGSDQKAFPLVWVPPGSKIAQLPSVQGNLRVRVSESTAITDKIVVKTYITRSSSPDAVRNATMNGKDPQKLRPKTVTGKTVSSDDPLSAFLPKKP